MSKPTRCSACKGGEFEAALVKLKNSNLYASVVQCANCGNVIGMLSTWEHSQIIDFIKEVKIPD